MSSETTNETFLVDTETVNAQKYAVYYYPNPFNAWDVTMYDDYFVGEPHNVIIRLTTA